jgi:hypothetical protein
LINYQTNNEKEVIKSEIEIMMDQRAKKSIKLLPPLSDSKSPDLHLDLNENKHKIIYLASKKDRNLRFDGAVYNIDFVYQSKLENLMERLKSSYINNKEPVKPEMIFKSKMSLWKPLEFKYKISGFDINKYDKRYPIISDDFIQILNMDNHLMMRKESVTDEYYYLKILQGMRRLTQTKCILSYNTEKKTDDVASFEKLAEVVVGVNMDLDKQNQVELFFFDNSTDYRSIYFDMNKHLKNTDENYNDRKILSRRMLRKIG